MKKTDGVYLADMLEMILKIESFVGDLSYDEFELYDEKQFAVFHALEVMGEAANKLSSEFAQNNPSFPVRETVEMRNILIHGYDIIRLDIVWKTIKTNLSPLRSQIEKLLKE